MSHLAALEPHDEHNQRLEAAVHPSDWTNPTPDGRYHLVVIGAGTAGLVTAAGAAGLGAKVALVERALMGGDCLNVGCVPSKGLLSAGRAAAAVTGAHEFGVRVPTGTKVDFSAVMERMRRLRAGISHLDSAKRFQELGVDVYLGDAHFEDSSHVKVGDARLNFKRAVIATGARASAPPIPGLDQVDYLTNESVFSLTKLPRRLGVIGAGPIGCEMAQAFARFGSEVFLIEATHGVLPREDQDAAGVVKESLLRDGVQLFCCGKKLQLAQSGDAISMTGSSHDNPYEFQVDQLLVAVGRAPNVDGLNLEGIGVEFDPRKGVTVNDRLQTTNARIFAAGDICSKYQFTHAADFMARAVIQNALFMGRKKASNLVIPWCTYTEPELAHVGLNENDAHDQGIVIDTYRQDFAEVDRAILEGETDGFVKIHVAQGTDRIVGATIVAPNAGDMIGEISLAMTHGIGLGKIASAIHPYPTQAEAIRKVGDQFNRTKLTPKVKWVFNKWLGWTR
ncbi:MAG: mercuric reductase [Aeoliella sp.]